MGKLDNIPKQNPFELPDDYFDNFPGKMQERLSDEKEGTLRKRSLALLKPQFALAAAMIFFALISYTVIRLVINPDDAITEENLSLAEVQYEVHDYMVYDMWMEDTSIKEEESFVYSDEIYNGEIADEDTYSAESVQNTDIQAQTETVDDEEADEIIDYLIDVDVDEYLLLAEI